MRVRVLLVFGFDQCFMNESEECYYECVNVNDDFDDDVMDVNVIQNDHQFILCLLKQ